MGVAPDFVFFVLACVEYSLGTTESKLPFFHISSHSLKIAVMISDTDFLSNKLTYPVRTLSIQRERKHLFILGCFLFCYCCIFCLFVTLFSLYSWLWSWETPRDPCTFICPPHQHSQGWTPSFRSCSSGLLVCQHFGNRLWVVFITAVVETW